MRYQKWRVYHKTGKGHFGAAVWAPPIRHWTTGRRAVSVPDISALFPNFILFFELWRKNNEAGNSLNAVEREPVPTSVLNSNASEASYKPKQRSYRKTKLKKTWGPIVQAPKCLGFTVVDLN